MSKDTYEYTNRQALNALAYLFLSHDFKTERTAKLFINQFYYSMKKKIYGALVLGSLLLSGGMVSCSDYDDDINSLNERVDGIEKTLADLKAKIEAGAVITKVENTSNGVKVTLSNGESFELTNGKDGANGADGKPGSTVSVDSEGYWTIDGNRVTVGGKPIKAEGEKGEQGEAGTPGEDGQDGKDGKWYEPNEDGFWYECAYNEEGEVVKTKTDSQWIPATDEGVRVVYNPDGGYMLIYGAEGTDEAIRIDITSDLKSLALIPYVIDSESGLSEIGFYNIIAKDGKIAESTDAKAHYRLNPANADVNAWEWSMIDRTAQVRAAGDNVNDLLVISDKNVDAGELTVTLKSRKSLEGLAQDQIAIFALAGNNKTTGEQIVSDYGKVVSEDLKNFAIVNESLGGGAFDSEYPTTEPAKTAAADAKLVYNESLDLNTLAWTWVKDLTPNNVTLEGLEIDGLTYTFEKPKTYLGNDGVTNQQEFVVLEGSTVKVNEYGTAAIGRTPIFLAKALVNGKEVASGYIKLEVVESAPAADKEDEILTVDCGIINYQALDALAAGTKIKGLEWTVVNQFYAKYNLTVDKFRAAYNEPTAANVVAEAGVELTNNWWNDQSGTTTDAATIDMDPTQVAVVAKLGQKREATITFESKNKKVYPNVVVKFVYQIEDNVTFPELNEDYKIGENMVQVKGRLVGDKWTMISAIKEHFENYLVGYTTPANHNEDLVASLKPLQAGASITFGVATTQDIQLTAPLTEDHRDYVVYLNMILANGEGQRFTYTVRFASPYTVSLEKITLKTLPAQVSKADLSRAVVVTGPNGEVIYQNGAVTSAADTYKFATSGYSFDYDLTGSTTDSWESFGGNLTLSDDGMIEWANDGTDLQRNKIATSKVTMTVPNVVIDGAEGVVEILSTANSKK